ncbi:ArpU family phage packaging/lysis transcriptional regulator [Priestia aryabhattai]|uniref:ArpU family phage packaging/lysis transcriptional regulator n=1 Tax=Priestia aryabhattai TaxID=412384 RepID=UPI003C8C5183
MMATLSKSENKKNNENGFERQVQKTVTEELKRYKALKVAMQNKNELKAAGIDVLFPSIVKLEQSDKEKELKIQQIERVLYEVLDDIERRIIEDKYLKLKPVKDPELFYDLGLSKNQFYDKKRQALNQIAQALRII